MVHSGYEATAVDDTFSNPLKALMVAVRGIKTEGEMAPEIDLSSQREADYVHDELVGDFMTRLEEEDSKHGGDLKKTRVRAAMTPNNSSGGGSSSESDVRAA